MADSDLCTSIERLHDIVLVVQQTAERSEYGQIENTSVWHRLGDALLHIMTALRVPGRAGKRRSDVNHTERAPLLQFRVAIQEVLGWVATSVEEQALRNFPASKLLLRPLLNEPAHWSQAGACANHHEGNSRVSRRVEGRVGYADGELDLVSGPQTRKICRGDPEVGLVAAGQRRRVDDTDGKREPLRIPQRGR